MDQDAITKISDILEYPLNKKGNIISKRNGLISKRPRLDAPPPNHPGSVDWMAIQAFGSREEAIRRAESMVAGLGEEADDKWVRLVILYRQWEIMYRRGELHEPPNLNQVCQSLDMSAAVFIKGLRSEIQPMMAEIAKIQAAAALPEVMNKVIDKATSDKADTKDHEMFLKLSGVIAEKGGGLTVNVTQQQAMLAAKERDKLLAPLLQFSGTVEEIDDEARKEK